VGGILAFLSQRTSSQQLNKATDALLLDETSLRQRKKKGRKKNRSIWIQVSVILASRVALRT
jgi:hypothetical protein